MRSLLLCAAALLAVVMLAISCNTVDPSECWPNTSGGFGGSGTIPIGAGVGVGSGDFASPRFGPLGYGSPANPCVSNGGDTTKPGGPAGGTSAAAGGGGGVLCEVAMGGGTGGAGGSGAGGSGAGGASGTGGDVVMCGNFPASLFKFKTIVPDDGTGDAGGWQQAPVSLNYVRMVPPLGLWTCSFTVGMPIRAKAYGVISPADAAAITAEIVSQAWSDTRASQPDAPGGIFCAAFKARATVLFGKLTSLGARVMP